MLKLTKVFLVWAIIVLPWACNKTSLEEETKVEKPPKKNSQDIKFQVFEKSSPHYGKGDVVVTFKSKVARKSNSAGNGRTEIVSWRDVYAQEITSGKVHGSIDLNQLDDYNVMSQNLDYIEIKKPGYMVILLDQWKDPEHSLVFTKVGKHSLVNSYPKKKNAKGALIQGYSTDYYNRVIITKADAVVAWKKNKRVLAFPGASSHSADILNGVDLGQFHFIATHIIVPPNVTVAFYNPNHDPKGNKEFSLGSGFHTAPNYNYPIFGDDISVAIKLARGQLKTTGFGYRIKATNSYCKGDVALYGSMFYRGGNIRINVCTDPNWVINHSGYDLSTTASAKIPQDVRLDIVREMNGLYNVQTRTWNNGNVSFVGWGRYGRRVQSITVWGNGNYRDRGSSVSILNIR